MYVDACFLIAARIEVVAKEATKSLGGGQNILSGHICMHDL